MGVTRLKKKLQRNGQQWLTDMCLKLKRNHLWQRMLKNTICTTITLILGIIPAVVAVYGRATYLGPMASVFGHPGQRFGQMTEVLFLITLGTFVGMGWGLLGLHLSSLVYDTNVEAAWAIRAVFFTLALLLHGVLRSSTPRLFMFVFWFLLVNLTILTSKATSISTALVTQIIYPILTAIMVIILVNVTIFPEFSSAFLGTSTIETLAETMSCFQEAGDWFMSNTKELSGEATEETLSTQLRTRLVALTDQKTKLRTKLGSSKAVQAECNFELVFAVLPPRSLKPISMTLMSRLVQVTICLINACESKYALAGYGHDEDRLEETKDKDADSDDSDTDSGSGSSSESSEESDDAESQHGSKHPRKSRHRRNLELVKPVREIASGDIDLLEHIMSQVRVPAKVLLVQIQDAVHVVTSSLAYCYDVHTLPSGSPTPDGIILEEIDLRVNIFTNALSQFDLDSAIALENAAAMAYGKDSQGDITPRMETHLVSSFLISFRQAASQVMDMLKESRTLVERRQARHNHRRLYWPQISWKKWLTTGGERDGMALPENARKEARAGHGLREDKRGKDDDEANNSSETLVREKTDEETGAAVTRQPTYPEKGKIPRRKGPQKPNVTNVTWLRGLAADAFELFADSDDLAFALKMCVAAFIVTWPAFVPSLNAWYGSIRGSWASLQLILVFEVSVGTSFQGFFLRAFGVVFGCTVGFVAYEIGHGNRVALVIILVLGIIPSTYFHLGTPYVKTGIISITSMSVVGLGKHHSFISVEFWAAHLAIATVVTTNNDEAWEIYVKRLVCFLVGGAVALVIEMTLFPVRARDMLVESLASSIQQISNMEASVAAGVDSPKNINFKSQALNQSFTRAKGKAEQALSAARTFLPFTLTEPRLKGPMSPVLECTNTGEMIYVLFQIIDRMDNMLHARKAYGSSVLEEMHHAVLPYRRNVAASITLTLFAVHEALTTRLPLPQFLPSSRVAQLRYVSRVRELLVEQAAASALQSGVQTPATTGSRHGSIPLQGHALKSMTRQNFLAWNAASAGTMEIIEYLEELVDLAKLLVGVNAFRTGMLERPKFHEYAAKIRARQTALAAATAAETEQPVEKVRSKASGSGRKRRGFSFGRRPSVGATGIGSEGVLGGTLRRRQTAGARTGDAAMDSGDDGEREDAVVDDLPMSLQRVMSRRIEGRELERLGRRHTEDPKGKRALRGARTWMG
ncbi:Uu.00g023130.m01.CDS01 [Anthostomella pinea]|uniref:Uu.00g023130.m01.CDS01 n=1 Tax=Anthostomella pinea TaxID=933095 RepID=A0AAI8YQX1_9PEZI|nr:Uu.00g023130.m01.CDS01 [Anthostomella pinea]